MKKRNIVTAVLACFCCLLLVFPALATKSGLEDAKKKKTALEEEKNRYKALEGAGAQREKLAAALEQLETQLETLRTFAEEYKAYARGRYHPALSQMRQQACEKGFQENWQDLLWLL